MSFINANTANPTDPSQIGFTHQTQPFSTTTYSSNTPTYVYDTYVIPKGMWLITASVQMEAYSNGSLTTTAVRIAFPGSTPGINLIANSFPPSGVFTLNSYVGEPYYSDGTSSNICGIVCYATSNNGSFVLQGTTSMTYVKIA
jgi:hypothetical protein